MYCDRRGTVKTFQTKIPGQNFPNKTPRKLRQTPCKACKGYLTSLRLKAVALNRPRATTYATLVLWLCQSQVWRQEEGNDNHIYLSVVIRQLTATMSFGNTVGLHVSLAL